MKYFHKNKQLQYSTSAYPPKPPFMFCAFIINLKVLNKGHVVSCLIVSCLRKGIKLVYSWFSASAQCSVLNAWPTFFCQIELSYYFHKGSMKNLTREYSTKVFSRTVAQSPKSKSRS